MRKPLGGRETMTSKERVLTTFRHGEADRVPINYSANPGINKRLMEYFGLEQGKGPGLAETLGTDFRGVGAGYKGPKLHEPIEGRAVDPLWGIHRLWIEHGAGGYWDYCDFPLKDADEEMIANWPMPKASDHDFSQVAEACRKNEGYAVIAATGFRRHYQRQRLSARHGADVSRLGDGEPSWHPPDRSTDGLPI